ncbi:MAG: FAD-binding protein, partial [Pseudobdellovibrionaceae bacterium]
MKTIKTDLLVIGSGLAGFTISLKMASPSCRVVLLTKEKIPDTNTSMAQGGIASVQSSEDSFASHIQDTLIAGAGLCDENAVRNIIEQAPERIQDLQNWGVAFDSDLTKEGGHSFRRILHFEDQTGLHIHQQLARLVKNHPHIEICEDEMAIDLILNRKIDPLDLSPVKCVGVYSLNKNTLEVNSFV